MYHIAAIFSNAMDDMSDISLINYMMTADLYKDLGLPQHGRPSRKHSFPFENRPVWSFAAVTHCCGTMRMIATSK